MTSMTPKEQFRAGFLLKCAEDGRNMDEIRVMIKRAIPIIGPIVHGLGAGLGLSAGHAAADVPSVLGTAYTHYMASPAVIAGLGALLTAGAGAGIGAGLGHAQSEDVDVDELKKQELIQAYKSHAARIRQLAALKPPKEHISSSRLIH